MFFDTTQLTDLNTIPAFLIDSVDVVTGGASAVYGSDALAGVTNFHLRNDLKGALAGGMLLDHAGRRRPPLRHLPRDRHASLTAAATSPSTANITTAAIFQNAGFSQCLCRQWRRWVPCGGSDERPAGPLHGSRDGRIGAGASCGLPAMGKPVSASKFRLSRHCHRHELQRRPTLGASFNMPGRVARSPTRPIASFAPSNYLMVPQKRWSTGVATASMGSSTANTSIPRCRSLITGWTASSRPLR